MCQGTSTHINLTGDEIKARYLAMNAALLNVRSLIASANISKGAPKPFLAESLPSEDDDMGLIDWIQDLSAAGLKAVQEKIKTNYHKFGSKITRSSESKGKEEKTPEESVDSKNESSKQENKEDTTVAPEIQNEYKTLNK